MLIRLTSYFLLGLLWGIIGFGAVTLGTLLIHLGNLCFPTQTGVCLSLQTVVSDYFLIGRYASDQVANVLMWLPLVLLWVGVLFLLSAFLAIRQLIDEKHVARMTLVIASGAAAVMLIVLLQAVLSARLVPWYQGVTERELCRATVPGGTPFPFANYFAALPAATAPPADRCLIAPADYNHPFYTFKGLFDTADRALWGALGVFVVLLIPLVLERAQLRPPPLVEHLDTLRCPRCAVYSADGKQAPSCSHCQAIRSQDYATMTLLPSSAQADDPTVVTLETRFDPYGQLLQRAEVTLNLHRLWEYVTHQPDQEWRLREVPPNKIRLTRRQLTSQPVTLRVELRPNSAQSAEPRLLSASAEAKGFHKPIEAAFHYPPE